MFFKIAKSALLLLGAITPLSRGKLTTSETNITLTIANDRVSFVLNKTDGIIHSVIFDGVQVLGVPVDNTSAIGPYVDAYFTPAENDYNPGGGPGSNYQLINGTDSFGIDYGGMVMRQPNSEGYVGETIEQYWFLRDTETSLHAFTRVAYENTTTPLLCEFIQLRTLFRPHGYFFTHLSSTDDWYVPQPRPNPAIDSVADLGIATQVQDTTWYIGNRTGDPFVENVADYYTKYSMSGAYRYHLVHGLFADGTNTPDNTTFGAWTIFNTKDTFFGGPTYVDLLEDGLLYNYIISNHYGDSVPLIENGFDRTFGPAVFHLNHGAKNGSLDALRSEALSFANNTYAHQFYDDIAKYVPGYVTTSGRGSWKAKIAAPAGANNTIAILTAPGMDYQDNVNATGTYQYWVEVPASGEVEVKRIKAGDYRLTMYADNIFGDFVFENLTVSAGQWTDSGTISWTADSAGKELWRLGTPDKSAGEFKHGYQRDLTHPLHPQEYRIYWGAYDFVNDFPNGVNFKINQSSLVDDFNYVHWSVFGGTYTRPQVMAAPTINNWTVSFDLQTNELQGTKNATLTMQLAGVSTSAGNTDTFSNSSKYSNLPYVVVMNGHELEPWIIPYYHSSSCASRSGIACYQVAHKFNFTTDWLVSNQTNEMILSLPFNASGISVLYDAIRLEVE